jgi:uncharacterized protein (TIGR02118 family)
VVKRISLVRRLPHLSHDEFIAHWSGPHVELVRRLPGLRGLRLGFVQGEWLPPEAAWDGVGEVWFDTREEAEQAFRTEPLASQLVEDRKLFLGEAHVCFVEERTIVPPRGLIKDRRLDGR